MTIVVLVGVDLRTILMTVSVDLEVDDDVTMEDAVVEDEVCLKLVMIDEYALLAMLKTETLTEFHEELFDLVENGGFELGFAAMGIVFVLAAAMLCVSAIFTFCKDKIKE